MTTRHLRSGRAHQPASIAIAESTLTVVHVDSCPLRVGILAYGLDRATSGIGRYAIELVRALRTHHAELEVILLKPFDDPVADLDGGQDVRLRGTRLLPAMMALGPLEIVSAARRHRLDVVHDPTGVSPFLLPYRVGKFARIVTLHDAVPFVHPETHVRLTNFLFRSYIPRTLRYVDRIITDSESSSRDIQRFFRVDESRVTRIYCGVNERFRSQPPERVAEVLSRYGLEPPYLLVVGALQERKNLQTAFEAFARLKSGGLPHRLVVVGRKAWKTEGLFQRLDELGLGDEVRLTGYVEEADLPPLYAGAACFLFPSLYEGFGLPPLEAMACGTPVVASNTSSIPEVVGDAGILVDPHDVAGFTDALRSVIEQPSLATRLRKRGLVRARQFTWERTAAAHATAYHEAWQEARR
jgi:glycosyltransferase involved in cell wall biosynthesis